VVVAPYLTQLNSSFSSQSFGFGPGAVPVAFEVDIVAVGLIQIPPRSMVLPGNLSFSQCSAFIRLFSGRTADDVPTKRLYLHR
jgi:hypothetical protein